MDETARRAIAVNESQFFLGNQRVDEPLAVFVRNEAYADVRDANHVAHVRASTPDEIDALFRRCDELYAHAPHLAFHCDMSTPPAFEARLLFEGYEMRADLVMLLEGALHGSARAFEIRPVVSEEDWRSFEELYAVDWAEHRQRLAQEPEPAVGVRLARTRRAKCPPAQYYLGYIDGTARGYFSTLPGLDGVAQVEDLFVHPAYRHRGLATALIHHCVAACRAAGAGPVVIVADPTDTPMHMYAAMGFRPVGVKRNYWKPHPSDATSAP